MHARMRQAPCVLTYVCMRPSSLLFVLVHSDRFQHFPALKAPRVELVSFADICLIFQPCIHPTRGSSVFLGKVTALGVLCCMLCLVVV